MTLADFTLILGYICMYIMWAGTIWMLGDIYFFESTIKKLLKEGISYEEFNKLKHYTGLGAGYRVWWENFKKKS